MKPINIQLHEDTIKKVKAIAEFEQLPYTVMIRSWIAQRIREYAPTETLPRDTVGAAGHRPIKESVPA